MSNSEIIRRGLSRGLEKEDPVYVSTGSTLLNLALTGHPDHGFRAGTYVHIVGDSQSGKTWLALTCFAEAVRSTHFCNHRLIFDDVERGVLMDIENFFGRTVAERIEPPGINEDGSPAFSGTIEEFYWSMDDALQDGRPFLAVLDSQDSLSSLAEQDKFAENKRAGRDGKELTGSYGDTKAKVHSSSLRKITGRLGRSKSILIIISQTRDSFDPFVKFTYSGGKALGFYARTELWSRVKTQIKKTVLGNQRQIGTLCEVRVTKNSVTGRRDRIVQLPIYFSYGIDDIGSMVDWLVAEKYWTKSGKSVRTKGLGPERIGTREKIIRQFAEDSDKENDLRQLVAAVWEEIEKGCELKRKRRYQ